MIIADHGHTPVLRDPQHALGCRSNDGPAAVVKSAGFRPRKFVLNPGPNEQDYQAAFAYQGAIGLRLPGRPLDLSQSRHDLRLEASAQIQTGRAAGCARILQLEQNRQPDSVDEGQARFDLRAGSDSAGERYRRSTKSSMAMGWCRFRNTCVPSAARPDPARPADAMAERGALGRSQRRRPAAHKIGTEQSDPESLLLLRAVSFMARERVAAGQPRPADCCAAKLFRREAQRRSLTRPAGPSAVASVAGAGGLSGCWYRNRRPHPQCRAPIREAPRQPDLPRRRLRLLRDRPRQRRPLRNLNEVAVGVADE